MLLSLVYGEKINTLNDYQLFKISFSMFCNRVYKLFHLRVFYLETTIYRSFNGRILIFSYLLMITMYKSRHLF